MIVAQFDALGRAGPPHEANPPVIADADRMLVRPIARQRFKPVCWRNSKITQLAGLVQHDELDASPLGDIPCDALYVVPAEDRRCALVRDARYHDGSYTAVIT